MNAEIICVGTELLLGDILNTNAQYLSRCLAELGFNVFSQSVIGDNNQRLFSQLEESLKRSEIIILSGGLGPTDDDITKEITAKVLGLELELHDATFKKIEDYFAKTGRVMSENNKKQAMVIKGGTVLNNENGTAPGYLVKNENNIIVLLPGPPAELIPMFENEVKPVLSAMSGGVIHSERVRVFGIGESAAAEICGDLVKESNPTVATYAKPGEVDIRVTAKAISENKAEEMCRPVVDSLKKRFGSNVYGINCENLQERVVKLLAAKGKKIATAESCTAGMLSGRITEIPGSSDVFEMGVTAYANHIKVQALGVDKTVIAEKGAVCGEVAAQMADGIRSMCGADIGVGITGVAGPGESEGKPAGLVYIAISDSKNVFVRKIMCRGSNRENTRIIASSTALDMVRRYLEGCEDLLFAGSPIGASINVIEGYALPEIKEEKSNEIPLQLKPLQNRLTFSDEEMRKLLILADKMENENENADKSEEKTNMPGFAFDDEEMYVFGDDDSFDEKPDKLELPGENFDFPMLTDVETDTKKPKKAKKQKKPKKMNRFIVSVFPVKGDKKSEKVRKSAFLVAFIVLVAIVFGLVGYFAEAFIQSSKNSAVADKWSQNIETIGYQKDENGVFLAFDSLIQQNKDTKGWIKINGTHINYPVYQTSDNYYYLNHDMNKKKSRYGALFIDSSNKIGVNDNSKNVVIYGHSMRNGSMFGDLKKYLDYDFYKENSTFDFTGIYRSGTYKVFSVFITNTLPEHDNGEIFNYRRSEFDDEADFDAWIEQLKNRSVVTTDIDITFDDEILTLSTEAYDFDEARLVVVAKRLNDDGYDKYKFYSSSINPNPVYPEIWYTEKGLKKPLNSTSSNDASQVNSGEATDVSSQQPTQEQSSENTSNDSTLSSASDILSNGENVSNTSSSSAENSDVSATSSLISSD